MSEDEQVPPAPPSDAPPPPASPPPAPAAGGGGSENRTLWIILAYCWLLALIPLLAEQEDKDVQWHSKHGLVLTGAEAVVWVALWVISTMTCVGCLIAIPLVIGSIIVRILCIDKALKGGRFTIPGLSELADRF
ncbi:MAG: hypothetical protein V3T72_20965 [Thermoanaerobaculia bacterium]